SRIATLNNMIYAALILAFACLCGVVWLLVRHAESPASAVLVLTVLMLSSAFVDYATSGLENPLTFLLLAGFGTLFLRSDFNTRDLSILSLLASLALVNRLDTALFYAPALLYAFLSAKNKPSAFFVMALGQLPIILWEIFSLIYYGFPFPNTYYAKIGNGIPQSELWVQGFAYLRDSLFYDPLTLTIVAVSVMTCFIGVHRWRKVMLAIGAVLYIFYITRIGGDFMSGRFFAAPLVVAVVLISQVKFDWHLPQGRTAFAGALVSILLIGFMSPLPTFRIGTPEMGDFRETGIADERIYYSARGNSIALQSRFTYILQLSDSTDVWSPSEALTGFAIGGLGLRVDQDSYLIDPWALGDPLTARLPAAYDAAWRVGHFERTIPAGYQQTLNSGYNQLSDPALTQYYDVLMLITRGDIWDSERLQAIWDMNTGQYDSLIDEQRYRYPDLTTINQGDLDAIFAGDADTRQRILEPAISSVCPSGIQVGQSGILINLADISNADLLSVNLQSTDIEQSRYRIRFQRDGNVVGMLEFFGNASQLYIDVPNPAVRDGYDAIHILPRVELTERDCINGLAFLSYAEIAETLSSNLPTLQADDVLLIQQSPLWEAGLFDYADTLFENASYLSSFNVRNTPNTVTVSNPFSPTLHTTLRDALNAGNQVFYLRVDTPSPTSYPIPQLLISEAIMTTSTLDSDLPFTLNTYAPTNVESATFGNIVSVVDWQIDNTSVVACDTITVDSLWHKASPFAQEQVLLNVALVLADDTGGIAQVDGLPAERNFENWSVTEQYSDTRTLTVPCDTPAGDYRLLMTMYNYQSGESTSVTQDGESVGLQLQIGTITVE
ncbi:MAG: hypothetical protein AAF126_05030, partial [Chloroflexota bacterium]